MNMAKSFNQVLKLIGLKAKRGWHGMLGTLALGLSLGSLAACGDANVYSLEENTGGAITLAHAASGQPHVGPKKNANHGDKTYKVIFGPPFPPFLLLDGKGGVMGFEVDLLDEIARSQNISFTYGTYPWNGLFDNLANGKCDVVGAGITINKERAKRFDFSEPFFQSNQMAFSLKKLDFDNPAAFKDYKAVVQRNTSSSEFLTNELGKQGNIREVDSVFLGVKDILNHRADFMISDSGPLLYYSERYNEFEPHVYTFKQLPTEYFGFVISNFRQDDLKQKLDKGMKDMVASGKFDEIYKKWFNKTPPKMPSLEEIKKTF